jgi:hypothetical protein
MKQNKIPVKYLKICLPGKQVLSELVDFGIFRPFTQILEKMIIVLHKGEDLDPFFCRGIYLGGFQKFENPIFLS